MRIGIKTYYILQHIGLTVMVILLVAESRRAFLEKAVRSRAEQRVTAFLRSRVERKKNPGRQRRAGCCCFLQEEQSSRYMLLLLLLLFSFYSAYNCFSDRAWHGERY